LIQFKNYTPKSLPKLKKIQISLKKLKPKILKEIKRNIQAKKYPEPKEETEPSKKSKLPSKINDVTLKLILINFDIID